MSSIKSSKDVLMLGTFGMSPKATLRSRALAIAETLSHQYSFRLVTTPWDNPADAGSRWSEGHVRIVNTRAVRPLLFPLAVREMVREYDTVRPGIVHLFKPKGFGDLAARRLSRQAPVVVDMDDWEGNGGWNDIGGYGLFQRILFDWQERTWPRRAAAVTVASRELERRAEDLGAAPESIFYLPNGLTREHFDDLASQSIYADAARQEISLAGKHVILLYTRFVEFEPTMIISLLSAIHREISDTVLLVVGASGDGKAETVLLAAAHAAGLAEAIDFRGWTPPGEIPKLLSIGDVAIHPFADSVVNRSKCSVKLLELMASGRPVVTNEVGENSHVVERGTSGLLVQAGDVPAMADAVINLIRHPQRARELGAAARRRVKDHYLWEQLAPRAADAYLHALERPPRDVN